MAHSMLRPAFCTRFLYSPPVIRLFSSTPAACGGGPRNIEHKGKNSKYPKGAKNTTKYNKRGGKDKWEGKPKREKKPKPDAKKTKNLFKPDGPRAPPRPRFTPGILRYIPPSNPIRKEAGPGMVYKPDPSQAAAANRVASGHADPALELEYLYVLMLRRTKAATSGVVTLKYAILRCMGASGAHKKATATRLRKGFLGAMIGSRMTAKNRAWVAQRAKVDAFDWHLHEEMRRLKGIHFTGVEVNIEPPDGQVLGESEIKAEENPEHQEDERSEEMDWSDEEEREEEDEGLALGGEGAGDR